MLILKLATLSSHSPTFIDFEMVSIFVGFMNDGMEGREVMFVLSMMILPISWFLIT